MGRLRSRRDREAGTVLILVVMMLLPVLGFAAYAIDGAYIHTTWAQLRHAADAAALAGIGAIRDGEDSTTAVARARETAESHEAGNKTVALATDGSAVRVGSYDLATGVFTPGASASGVPAVRVEVRRDASSAAGPLELFFARVLGIETANLAASAIGAVRKRNIVIVQDVTYSFREEFADAIEADEALVDAMGGEMALSGDRVGLVTFARIAREELGLVPLADPGQLDTVIDTIRDFEVCQDASVETGCNGTGTADGINQARLIFERDATADDAEKVMVIVTDGVPCYVEDSDPTARARADALQAADDALDEGISIFAIALAVPAPPGSHVCLVPDETFALQLARGFGIGISTPDSDDLDDILVSIVRQMPLRLVR